MNRFKINFTLKKYILEKTVLLLSSEPSNKYDTKKQLWEKL